MRLLANVEAFRQRLAKPIVSMEMVESGSTHWQFPLVKIVNGGANWPDPFSAEFTYRRFEGRIPNREILRAMIDNMLLPPARGAAASQTAGLFENRCLPPVRLKLPRARKSGNPRAYNSDPLHLPSTL